MLCITAQDHFHDLISQEHSNLSPLPSVHILFQKSKTTHGFPKLFYISCLAYGPSYRNMCPIYLLMSSYSIPNQFLKQTSYIISSTHTSSAVASAPNIDLSCAPLLLGHLLLHFPRCMVIVLSSPIMSTFRGKTQTHRQDIVSTQMVLTHSNIPHTLRFHTCLFTSFHKHTVRFISQYTHISNLMLYT